MNLTDVSFFFGVAVRYIARHSTIANMLTYGSSAHINNMPMLKRLTTLVLLMALAGSALAGVPFHAGEENSDMASCCKAALAQDGSPNTLRAKLCCAVNCTEPAPTAPTGAGRITPQLFATVHPAIIQSHQPLTLSLRGFHSRTDYLLDPSPPPYIRHVALLI